MLTNPSWKWLSSRLPIHELGNNPAFPSRPCLLAVEQLDDRLMLSATPSPSFQSGGHEGTTADTQILIGLIKGQLGLIQTELTAMKLAPGELKPSDIVQMKESLLNMDQEIVKLGQDAIAGNLTDLKQQKVLTSIDEIFAKVNSAIPPTLPGEDNNPLLPAIQKVREAAIKLVTDFAQPGGKVSVSLKQQKVLLAIPDELEEGDELLFKYDLKQTNPAFSNGLTPDVKLAEEFVKIDFLVSQLDDNLQGELKPVIAQVKIDTFDFLNSLNNQPPVDIGGGGEVFTGGIVLTDTGDLLA